MKKNKNSNLTKKNISKTIASSIGFSNLYIDVITRDFIDILISLIRKKNLIIKNFGKFKLIKKKERIGRNPKNKKTYKITSRISLSFTDCIIA